MRGHIRERSPGRWAIVLDLRGPAGERKRRWHSFTGTKRGAQLECARLIAELRNGTALNPAKTALRDYLMRWLAHIETQISPKTLQNYTEVVNLWLVPRLGNAIMTRLTPELIALAYSEALVRGGRNGRSLAPRSVKMMHRILSQALKQAVAWNLLATNPAASCKPPRIERKEMRVLDLAATAALVKFAEPGRLYIPILLLTSCGLRRGELAAIRWGRLDLDGGRLAVLTSIEQTAHATREKPPKNGRTRTVTLPAFLVDELRWHKIKQAEELLRLGIRQTDATHVCLNAEAKPWSPRMLTFEVSQLIRKAPGVPRVRLHDLRHSHATHLLMANVHPKIVSERLGHSSVSLTLDLYSHVLPALQEGAAGVIDSAMRAALKNNG
jgi:integrase